MTVDALLDFIAKPESGNNPNIVYGAIKTKHRPKKPLTSLTIGEVLNWQDSIDKLYNSEAAGAWQIMEDTLRNLPAEAGLTYKDLFNEKNQRKLATVLLKRRGLDKYLAGKISAKQFAQQISMEWASMPCTINDKMGRAAKGQSYYAGDGLNKSHVSIDAFMEAVVNAKQIVPVTPVVKGNRFLEFLASIISKIFKK